MTMLITEIKRDISGREQADATITVNGTTVSADLLMDLIFGEDATAETQEQGFVLASQICANTELTTAETTELANLTNKAAKLVANAILMRGETNELISEIHRLLAYKGGSTYFTSLAIAGSKEKLPGKLEQTPNGIGLVMRALYSLIAKLTNGINGEVSTDTINAINAFVANKGR